jgi:uncharacterized phage protein (TIGR02220 family)
MNNEEKDYDCSRLQIHFKETIYDNKDSDGKDIKFRKLFHNVILDSTSTTNDIAIYLGILKENYYLNKNRWYSQKRLGETTRIAQPNITKHVKELEIKGYIGFKTGWKSSYSVKSQNNKFYPLTCEHFEGLGINKKIYIDTLRLIILSSGNDKLPPMKTCQKRFTKMEKRYYKILKELRQGRSDVELYESLKDLSVVQPKLTSSLSEVFEMNVVEETIEERVEEVINFMSTLFNRDFDLKDNRNITLKILSKYTKNDVIKVCTYLKTQWDNDTMRRNLRPSTIFKEVYFKNYLSDAKEFKNGESLENAYLLKLEHKQVIDSQVTQYFIDDSLYHIFQYSVDKQGNLKGSSIKLVSYGRGIKRLIRVGDTNEKHNGVREYIYLYNKEGTLNQVA